MVIILKNLFLYAKRQKNTGFTIKNAEEKPKEEYIQPTVKAKEFIPSVYSARTTMDIYDPQSRLSQAIFIIKNENKYFVLISTMLLTILFLTEHLL